MLYSRKGYLINASSKKQAINKWLLEPLENKLLANRALLVKYFNVSSGNDDSILKVKCSTYDEAVKLRNLILSKRIITKIELESGVTLANEIKDNVIYFWIHGDNVYLRGNGNSFTFSNFLFLAKDKKTSLESISKYGLTDENTTIGSNSVQALIKLCIFLQSYKSRLFIDMIEP